MQRIIIFDGECNLCNASVQFIIKRDPTARYKFTSLQSEIGQQLLQENRIPPTLDSFIYIENEKVYSKSTAALKVCRRLGGLWKLAYVCIIIPRPVRDLVYEWVARNRYKWFGKRDSCMLPSPELRSRFLD
ncbi:thiol-disulfide oxidoreductase DCC family protein [Ornithinibacillus contaminans]|uniref:thiol-disulfide oxidoreductase DCC family protein n=1 Tax=Ornithinibacillus contaminans TaxID=694055 RepID=UPI00064D7E50|nr:thiol-disulfide oxidoreductase DCC family protein [Ornithinibacillus contaminans]